MRIPAPLDYSGTLEVLDSWTGRRVLVIAHSQAPGQPQSHTQAVVTGVLGPLEMADNAIDPNVEGVAAYAVGGGPNGFYLSSGDFLHAMPLGDGHINIKFCHDFHIEVQLIQEPESRDAP